MQRAVQFLESSSELLTSSIERGKLRKEFKISTEELRAFEKQELLKEQTTEHKQLIAKASDSSKYDFRLFYKIRDDADYVEHLSSENEKEELYDLKSDPEELINLSEMKRYSNTLKKYREETIAELKRTDAGFVNNLPELLTIRNENE